jgi:mandelamide amidase
VGLIGQAIRNGFAIEIGRQSLSWGKENVMDRHRHFLLLLGAAFAGLAAHGGQSPSRAEQTSIDLDGMTTKQAAADLCAGKITSKALTSAALARAKADKNLNAFVTLDEAGAMKAAAAFEAGHNKKSACKPLGGVPIVIKDNIEVAGLPASAGTPALKGFVPRKDAPVAAKLREAGAIIIGKTNMHELAFGISGYTRPAPSLAYATPMIRRKLPAVPRRGRQRQSAPGS